MFKKKEVVLIVLIVVLALASRFLFLDLRVLHGDEGVNYFFSDGILEGRGFAYNPLDYHGPFYFFALAFSFLIFGVNEFGLRFPAALFGFLLVMLPLVFGDRKEYNKYLVAVFLLVSSSLLYYSRYSIHEMSFVFFSLILVWSFSMFLEEKDFDFLIISALALGFLFVIKETVLIIGFVVFVLCIVHYGKIKKMNFKKNWGRLVMAGLLFLFVFTGFFTSFSTNPQGLGDSVEGFFSWTDKGVSEGGHNKPFFYYLKLLGVYEMPILLFAIFGLVFVFRNRELRRNVFAYNVSLWFVLSYLIYSSISYKTPWLIINFVVPMCFVAAIGFRYLRFKLGFKLLVLSLGILYLLFFGIFLNFVYFWQNNNDFAYVHTNEDALRLVDKVNEVYVEGDTMMIVADYYWPLPFYFDELQVSYLREDQYADFNFSSHELLIFDRKFFDDSVDVKGEVYGPYTLLRDDQMYLVVRD